MLLEQATNLLEVLVRHKAHRYLGVGTRRDNGLCTLLGVATPNAIHIERWADTRAFNGGVASLALNIVNIKGLLVLFEREWCLVERLALLGSQFAHLVVEVRNGDVTVLINERCHKASQDVGRVRHSTSKQPRMEVFVRSYDLHLHIGQTAQSAGYRWRIERNHRGIRHEDNIRLQLLLVLLAEAVERRRANLLLALKHKLDIAREGVGGAHRLERLDVHKRLTFVVISTTRVDAVVDDGRLERLSSPLLTRIYRHNIVVTIDQYGLGIGRDNLLGIDYRIALGRDNLGGVGSCFCECHSEMLGTLNHILLVR